MERFYFIRGRRDEVEQLDNLAAIKLDDQFETNDSERVTTSGKSASAKIRKEVADLSDDTLRAFAEDNWIFVEPNKVTRTAMSNSYTPENATESGAVIRRDDNSIAIVTQLLNVQIDLSLIHI